MAALAAEQVRRVAAAVDEDDGLLAGVERLAQRLLQRPLRDDEALVLLLRALLPQVDDLDLGQRPVFDAAGHAQQRVLAARGVLARLERRRGRAEDDRDLAVLRADDGQIAGVVARRLLLLVRAVAFLVDDDQAEALERREERGARTDGHVRLRRAARATTGRTARSRRDCCAGWRCARRSAPSAATRRPA